MRHEYTTHMAFMVSAYLFLPHLGVLGRLLNRVPCHRPAFPILLLEDGAPDLPGTKLPLEIYSCSLSGPRFKANIG
jgi:hypothetical protein